MAESVRETMEEKSMDAKFESPVNGDPSPTLTREWTMAALAHASVALALVFGTAGGIGALIGPAVALAMYLGQRDRSRFVAFHALQACIYQVIGILLYVASAAVMATAVTAAWTVSGLLSAVLIGFLLMPLALLLTLFMVMVLVGVPLVWLGYGLYAAYLVYQGRDFRYGVIGEWVEREVNI
ncbi:MAG TPA: DUF4870 domain-containing protein [Chloroflexi bacterium]|nr:DUF4870 domain-containing protein [Chloroflexota bacterium]